MMASVIQRPGKKFWVQFTYEGKRHTARLGMVSKSLAQRFSIDVQSLIDARKFCSPGDETFASRCSESAKRTLIKSGLVRIAKKTTLKELIRETVDQRADLKSSTVDNYRTITRDLYSHFGKDCDVALITTAQAQEFVASLQRRGLASATVAKRGRMARSFFRAAVRLGLAPNNPFSDVVLPSNSPQRQRQVYVPEELVDKLLAITDAEFGLVIAMARFGGLRCPSEFLEMRWDDIDLQDNRISVLSPKTERHAGHEHRVIPVFAKLRTHIDAWKEERGSGYLFPWMRDCAQGAPSRRLARLQESAGIKPWTKPWHNLRASCVTDLAERFPIQVVSAWAGHCETVSQRHYLQVLDHHFDRAAAS